MLLVAAAGFRPSLLQFNGCLVCTTATTMSSTPHPSYRPHSLAVYCSLSHSTFSSSLLRTVVSERKPAMIPLVLDHSESIHGILLTMADILTVVTHLRSSLKYYRALEVMQWMMSKGTRFHLCPGAMAVYLDLISRVRGVSAAEEFIVKFPDSSREGRTNCALLYAYVREQLVDKAKVLWEKMCKEGGQQVDTPLPFNIMMELCRIQGELDGVDSLVSEMVEKKVPMDSYSYTLWLSSQICPEKVRMVFEKMRQEEGVIPDWSTFSAMAGVFMKLGESEEAERWVRKMEGEEVEKKGRDAYHHLMNHYAGLGMRDEVVRVWEVYRDSMVDNKGYYVAIASLMKVGDISGAKRLYHDWLGEKKEGAYETRIGNLFIGWYVREEGRQDKAEGFFEDMMKEEGASGNSYSWGLMAEGFAKNGDTREALSCVSEAVAIGVEGGLRRGWKPCQRVVSCMVEVFKEKGDSGDRGNLADIFGRLGCIDKETYISLVGEK